MLKVRADRRKNGRLRKYHYSKIQNAGDCVARTGVREIGFKFGSLPHDPGGITCMLPSVLVLVQMKIDPYQLFSIRTCIYFGIVKIFIKAYTCIQNRSGCCCLHVQFDYPSIKTMISLYIYT